MSSEGPFTRQRAFRFAPAHGAEARGEPPARGRTVGGRVLLALGFRRGSGKGIVSITAGNAALSRRCPGRSRPQQHGAPEKEGGKCRAAAFMVFPLAKSAFTSIEPKSQSGRTRTSFQASSSARALFSLDVAIPSAAMGACRGSFVDGDSEGRTADAGRPTLVSWRSVRSPHASRAAPPTVRTGDAVMASATRASDPTCFTD